MTEQNKEKKTRRPRASKTITVTRSQCEGFAQVVSIPVQFIAPALALSEDETKALSIALYDAARSNQYVAQVINSFGQVGGIAELIIVTGAIIGKRVIAVQAARNPQASANLMVAGVGLDSVIASVAGKPIVDVENETVPDKPARVRRPRKDIPVESVE